MNCYIDDHDSNDFYITPLLQERLSSTSINWLQRLSKPSFPPVIFQTAVKGQESDGLKLESLESLVNVLLIEQVLESDGHLKSLPLFCALPTIVQERLLFIMQMNSSRLTHHTLTTFCNKIGRSPNMWVKELVRQLKTNLLNSSLPDTLNAPIGLHTEKYQLSPESSDSFKELLFHLQKREINPWQRGTPDVELSAQELEQPGIKENLTHFVDVIIIDEDDDDSCRPDVGQMESCGDVLDVEHTPLIIKDYPTTSDVSHSRKESIRENVDDGVGAGDKSALVFMESIKEDVMVNLATLREACKSESKEVTVDMLQPLVALAISEIKEACDFLELDQLTDKRLVNVFDNMPWAYLSLTSANILLKSSLIPKLTNMDAESSHLLLAAIISVATTQPKILVDILSQALCLTSSGIYQCQFVTAVIKQSLPLDSLGYLIGKLEQENVTANEHLLSVLQTVLDRKPELDLDTLTQLLSLLAMCSNKQNSNLTLGKILLAVISRYGKKMTSKQIIVMCTIVDSHTSNLKRSLHTAIKKIL